MFIIDFSGAVPVLCVMNKDQEIRGKGLFDGVVQNEVEAGYYWIGQALVYAGHQLSNYQQSEALLTLPGSSPSPKH